MIAKDNLSSTSAVQLRCTLAHRPDVFSSVAWSPDGCKLVTGSADRTIRIWEVEDDGCPLLTLVGHADAVTSVSWSPDGSRIASGSADHTLRIWDAKTGELQRLLRGHKAMISSVAWSPGGELLVSSSNDHTICLWDVTTRDPLLRTFEDHTDAVESVTWAQRYVPTFASLSSDKTLRLWKANTGELLHTIMLPKSKVNAVTWSPNGRTLAGASASGTVLLWNSEDGQQFNAIDGFNNTISSVAWSSDDILAIGTEGGIIHFWDTQARQLVGNPLYHGESIKSLAWSPDVLTLASVSADCTIRLWDRRREKKEGERYLLQRTIEGHTNTITGAAWAPDGQTLAVISANRKVHFWSTETTQSSIDSLIHNKPVNSVAWSPRGRELVSSSADGAIRLWHARLGMLLRKLAEGADVASSVAWSPDGKTIATVVPNYDIELRETDSGKVVHKLSGHTYKITSLRWSPSGNCLASLSDDLTLRLWDLETGRPLREIKLRSHLSSNVAWSSDGDRLASGGLTDHTVRIWNAVTGKRLHTLEGHTSAVQHVAWSPDDTVIASISNDRTVRLWAAATGAELEVFELKHQPYQVLDLSFQPPVADQLMFDRTNIGDPNILVRSFAIETLGLRPPDTALRYISAKILLVGESGVGKSGLALRLAEDRFEEQISTHVIRLWSLAPERLTPALAAPPGEKREVVLWDLGGQNEYRLIHQLFLHDTTVALMLLDPTRGSKAFEDVREWNVRLEKQLRGQPVIKLLVGTKLDEEKMTIDQAALEELQNLCGCRGYFPTSAKVPRGIDELMAAIAQAINWDDLSQTTRPSLFQRIRDAITERQQHGEVVLFYNELEKQMRAQEMEHYDGSAVNTVVEQLRRQGVIVEACLETGERVLVLQIGLVEKYAGALILAARHNQRGVPVIEESEVAAGRLALPGIKPGERLHPFQERIVLECVLQLLLQHGLCLKHEKTLVFPALFPSTTTTDGAEAKHTVSLYYDFSGAIDNIYSSLVAQLATSGKFGRVRLWKDRAEFDLAGQGVCGLQRMDRPGGWSHLDLLFGEKVKDETRDLFTVFVEEHLQKEGVTIREVLEMDCQKCGHRFEESVIKERIALGTADVLCSICETRSPINEGAQRVRSGKPSVVNKIFALGKAIDEKKRQDIDDAKREMRSVRVFVSYSHRDEALRASLTTHLSALRREGIIETWHDRIITAGAEWKDELDGNLESARIVLLLVSADFIASDYCVDIEVRRALERHAAGEARVIPIILRPVEGWDKMPFGKLQALPELGKPITSWTNQDEAFANVAAGIRKSVEELMRPAPDTQPQALITNSPVMPVVEPTPIRILHLSDLHFDRNTDPMVWLQPLVRDLKDRQGGLGVNELDYLVISGDLTNRASAEEFERAHEFISGLIEQFELSAARLVIVPGNHDLSWDVEAYGWHKESKVAAAKLKDGFFIKQGNGYLLREDAEYPKRFENFARFYHQLTQHPYSLKPESQFRSLLFDELRMQFLEMNSAFEIDEYFPERSGIQQSALANALLKANAQIETAKREKRIGQDASVFRIAVWHHPITGNEKIVRDVFVEQLRQEEFKLCLHGHVHEERADLIRYTHPRQIHVAGAGSFGAPMRQRPESTPRLYNVIEIARDHHRVRVHTRSLRKEGGAWEGWAVWPGSNGLEKRTFYDMEFKSDKG